MKTLLFLVMQIIRFCHEGQTKCFFIFEIVKGLFNNVRDGSRCGCSGSFLLSLEISLKTR
jgi:hypothetical protein